jgi:hypothetical protein
MIRTRLPVQQHRTEFHNNRGQAKILFAVLSVINLELVLKAFPYRHNEQTEAMVPPQSSTMLV